MWRSVGSQIQFQALKRRFFKLETKISCVYPHNWFKYEQLMALIWPLPNLYRLWKLWEESRGNLGLDTQSIFVTQNWEVPENRRWKMEFFFSNWIGTIFFVLNWRVTFHNKMDSLRIHFNKKIMLEDLDFGIFCFFTNRFSG